MHLDLENLPRTIDLVRSDSTFEYIPDGFPITVMLDQSKLPYVEETLFITDWREVIDCIKTLKVRGAPAIGIAGACAMVLRAAEFVYAQTDDMRKDAIDFERVFIIDETQFDLELYLTSMRYAADMIKRARPTAVNLAWAVDSCMAHVEKMAGTGASAKELGDELFNHVKNMIAEDETANRNIGCAGAELLPASCTVLTHCNAGSLATSFYGTALGVIYAAAQQGKIKHVYADETRPVCQGSRLTVWELSRAGVPVTLICDDMAASVMSQGRIDAVIVGADRIAANGDVANKIGTLGVAIMAKHFNIPFYVAAPCSTIDLSLSDGSLIPIEERSSAEVLEAPIEGVSVHNPAFDVTPAELITAIITEGGVFAPQDVSRAFSQ